MNEFGGHGCGGTLHEQLATELYVLLVAGHHLHRKLVQLVDGLRKKDGRFSQESNSVEE